MDPRLHHHINGKHASLVNLLRDNTFFREIILFFPDLVEFVQVEMKYENQLINFVSVVILLLCAGERIQWIARDSLA